jgi:hypothetical protein
MSIANARTPTPFKVPGPTPSLVRRIVATGLLALTLCGAPLLVGGCKKKAPKLSKNECDRFCKRLVPCFAQKMANFSMKQDEDTRECIQNCTSKNAENHAQTLRAMKKCGDIKDCAKLRKCFGETM